MSAALIIRDRSIAFTDAEKSAAHKMLTQGIRGVDDQNHKRWMRQVKRWFGLEDGEIAKVSAEVARSGPFHRFHMLIEQSVFKAQDRFDQMEMFRNWVKIGAGHVAWVPGARGGIVPLPKSISYAELEESDMREFHDNMLAFLRGPHAAPYLWRHLPTDKAAEMMESVLLEFDR